MTEADPGASPKELLFLQLVSMFQVAAMQQMGKLVNPATNEAEKDLAQAKVSIDILDLLKEKTQGNLTKTEEDFLEKLLFELHMNYVDEMKSSKEEESGGEKAKASEEGSSRAGEAEAAEDAAAGDAAKDTGEEKKDA